MDDYTKPETQLPDDPLFVLKYSKGRFFLRALCLSFFAFLFLILGYSLAHSFTTPAGFVDLFFKEAFCGILLFGLIWQLAELLRFKEIRLYGDRIVQVCKPTRVREIKLEKANLSTFSRGYISDFRIKCILDRDQYWQWQTSKGIWYNEKLADPEDVKKFNYLLAVLSGRTVEEFEREANLDPLIRPGYSRRVIDEHLFQDQKSDAGREGRYLDQPLNKERKSREFRARTDLGPLIKAGHSPQVIYEQTLDEQSLRALAKEKEYERTANRALVVVGLFVLMVPCALVLQSAGPAALIIIIPAALFGHMIWKAR